jgi:transcriptional regulator with XRE-family HTH domain
MAARNNRSENSAAIERRIAGRLAALRNERGWSLEALAEKAGISRATLSRLERCELSPTAATLGKLCAVHGWTLSRLMADAESVMPDLVRAGDQVSWRDPDSGYVRKAVSPPTLGLRAELVEVCLPPNATVSFETAPIPQLEHHLRILKGDLELEVEGKLFRLHPGDCVRYVLRGASRFRCCGKREVRYLIAIVHP